MCLPPRRSDTCCPNGKSHISGVQADSTTLGTRKFFGTSVSPYTVDLGFEFRHDPHHAMIRESMNHILAQIFGFVQLSGFQDQLPIRQIHFCPTFDCPWIECPIHNVCPYNFWSIPESVALLRFQSMFQQSFRILKAHSSHFVRF